MNALSISTAASDPIQFDVDRLPKGARQLVVATPVPLVMAESEVAPSSPAPPVTKKRKATPKSKKILKKLLPKPRQASQEACFKASLKVAKEKVAKKVLKKPALCPRDRCPLGQVPSRPRLPQSRNAVHQYLKGHSPHHIATPIFQKW